MSRESFASRLAAERKRLGLSQAELSKRLNVSQASIAKQETGKNYPSIELLEDYADLFRCSIDYLLGRTEYRTGHLIQKEKLPTELVDSGYTEVVKSGSQSLTEQEIEVLKRLAAQYRQQD